MKKKKGFTKQEFDNIWDKLDKEWKEHWKDVPKKERDYHKKIVNDYLKKGILPTKNRKKEK